MKSFKLIDNVILIIDGTNLIYRNYFVHSYRKTKSGVHTGGLYGTIRSIQSYINTFNPKQVYVCFDKSEYTFRSKMYPDYKMNRVETDKELLDQFVMLKEYCNLVNFPFIEIDLFEADDIIGSLACRAKEFNLHPYIVSGDRDLLQLIHKGIDVMYLSNKGPIIYSENQFEEEYNIKIGQYIEYKALVGDPSDNIPGIPGIGKKSAAKLLGLYNSLDGIYENIEELKGKQKQTVIDNKDKVYLYKELLTIKCDMELDFEDYFTRFVEEGYNVNSESAKEYLKEIEI
jgi:DNA polymerase-1